MEKLSPLPNFLVKATTSRDMVLMHPKTRLWSDKANPDIRGKLMALIISRCLPFEFTACPELEEYTNAVALDAWKKGKENTSAAPSYTLPTGNTVSADVLEEYSHMVAKVKMLHRTLLQAGKFPGLQSDGWQRNNLYHLGTVISWEFSSGRITGPLDLRWYEYHNKDAMGYVEILKETLSEWELDEFPAGTCSDRGSDAVAAYKSNDLHFLHVVFCILHFLNNLSEEGMPCKAGGEGGKAWTRRIKDVFAILRKGPIAVRLEDRCKANNERYSSPEKLYEVRWNSMYRALRQLKEMKTSIQEVLLYHNEHVKRRDQEVQPLDECESRSFSDMLHVMSEFFSFTFLLQRDEANLHLAMRIVANTYCRIYEQYEFVMTRLSNEEKGTLTNSMISQYGKHLGCLHRMLVYCSKYFRNVEKGLWKNYDLFITAHLLDPTVFSVERDEAGRETVHLPLLSQMAQIWSVPVLCDFEKIRAVGGLEQENNPFFPVKNMCIPNVNAVTRAYQAAQDSVQDGPALPTNRDIFSSARFHIVNWLKSDERKLEAVRQRNTAEAPEADDGVDFSDLSARRRINVGQGQSTTPLMSSAAAVPSTAFFHVTNRPISLHDKVDAELRDYLGDFVSFTLKKEEREKYEVVKAKTREEIADEHERNRIAGITATVDKNKKAFSVTKMWTSRDVEQRFPNLSKCMMSMLAISCAGARVGSLFSFSGRVVISSRGSLKPDKSKSLVQLRGWRGPEGYVAKLQEAMIKDGLLK